MLNAQLRASQIGNRHLRRCGVPVQLQELQDAYAQATDALEVQMLCYYIVHLSCVVYLAFYIEVERRAELLMKLHLRAVGCHLPYGIT